MTDNEKKEKEREETTLKHWRKQLEEVKALVGKSEQPENLKSLIENMGSIAQEEWDRLEHDQTARDGIRRMSGVEKEKYNPSQYLLCSIGICVASAFVKYYVPNATELDARLDLIGNAISSAEKTGSTNALGRAAGKL